MSERAGRVDEDTAAAPLPVLHAPEDGVPHVVTDEHELDEVADAIASGEGPVAIDAERASGYRYGQRAYLVQLKREGSGLWLIDPIALPDLTPVAEAIGDAEWILHAATQDLACLAEVGLRPRQLFDTELAGRLLGLPRVGLAAVLEHYLGISLAKEHSAVDWSTRPLPEPWLRYAALDVEVLGELRNLMGADLWQQGKSEWAREEFEALLDWTPQVRPEPWRRTSGINKVRTRRGLAVVRELWETRDAIAAERDISPGRLIPDPVLVEIALAEPHTPADLPRNRAVARYQRQWLAATSCPRPGSPTGHSRAKGRHRPRPGPRRTPSPPRDSRLLAPSSPRSPRSTPSPSRTSAPPSHCGASSGRRPRSTRRRPSLLLSPSTAFAPGSARSSPRCSRGLSLRHRRASRPTNVTSASPGRC